MIIRLLFIVLSFYIFAFSEVSADDTVRARFTPNATRYKHTLTVAPLKLANGSSLTLVSPAHLTGLTKKLSILLERTHQQYTKIFGEIPTLTTSIRLIDEREFFKVTAAPEWTNALFYKNEIIIPIPENVAEIDLENIFRAVKHEYTHAVVHALSAGRCPGWLDEGLAQWSEGPENPALQLALLELLKKNRYIPFDKLQGGFTKLDVELVPAAYAQSLYVTKELLTQHGFSALRRFFKVLRHGYSKDAAFIAGFNMNEGLIENIAIRRIKARLNQRQISAAQ